jgi:hypothetical protein
VCKDVNYVISSILQDVKFRLSVKVGLFSCLDSELRLCVRFSGDFVLVVICILF